MQLVDDNLIGVLNWNVVRFGLNSKLDFIFLFCTEQTDSNWFNIVFIIVCGVGEDLSIGDGEEVIIFISGDEISDSEGKYRDCKLYPYRYAIKYKKIIIPEIAKIPQNPYLYQFLGF